jgi:phage terminase large subunit
MTPAQARIKSWRQDPRRFVHDNFHVELDGWQHEALKSLCSAEYQPRRRLCMKSATGVGKSGLLAWIGWWRLACFGRKSEHPKGAALSGEGRDNLRDNLWAEFAKWQSKSPFLAQAFRWTKEQIYAVDHPETWFLSARSYAQDADAEAIGRSLSGLHSQFPFILLDETGGMPMTVGQKAEQIFTGSVYDGLIAQAGNPTSTSGLLYHVATAGAKGWVMISVTADPDDPNRSPRVDAEHAREQIAKYGRDNPWVMSTILGLFPPTAINSLLGPDEVEAAMHRHVPIDQYEDSQKRIGVDCARFGDDLTVLFPRQGLMSFKPVEMRNARTNEIAARIALAKSKWGSEIEMIDDTGGYGAGVIDSLIQAGHSPMAVNFAGKAIDPRFLNKRAEMWFNLSEWVKRGGALPQMPELKKELTSVTYAFQNGKFRIEDKDLIKKRLGFSCDRGDALAISFSLPELPRQAHQFAKSTNFKAEYDPFDPQRLGI